MLKLSSLWYTCTLFHTPFTHVTFALNAGPRNGDFMYNLETNLIKCTLFPQNTRSTSVYINGTLQWDQVQLMICRTTTPDLIKMMTRLEEFFSQQFQSSKQMLSSWQSMTPATRRAFTSANTSSRTTSDSDSQSDLGECCEWIWDLSIFMLGEWRTFTISHQQTHYLIQTLSQI